MNNRTAAQFVEAFDAFADHVHATAREKGWWDLDPQTLTDLASLEIAIDALPNDARAGATAALGRVTAILSKHNRGEKIALMHSELSEALEALRQGNPPDDKVPEMNGATVELADTVIRIMDLARREQWPVGAAIVAKASMNAGRPHRHGGKAF